MITVRIAELKNGLSSFLLRVKKGEEVLVLDRNTPIARISPYTSSNVSEDEQQLVASGTMLLPTEEIDWEDFWSLPSGNVPRKIAIQAVLDDRAEEI
jgi:prevent-host-death family protein